MYCLGAAPSRTKTYVTGEVISPSDVTENEDNVFSYLQAGVDTYRTSSIPSGALQDGAVTAAKLGTGAVTTTIILDGTIATADMAASSVTSSLIDDGTIVSADIADGTVVNSDINASAAIAQSKLSLTGIVLPSGALFFMITGSCPTGSTDVTATYSGKFVRANATGGSTGGADTHTHGAGSYAGPSHTHTVPASQQVWGMVADGGDGYINTLTSGYGKATTDAATSSSGTGAITGTSASGDNVPAYVTAKFCQVD